MASLKASPRLGSTGRGTGGGAEGAKTGAFGKGKEEKKRGCPPGSRRRGRCPPGVALRRGGMAQPRRGAGRQPEGAKRAAGSAASPRGRARGLGGCVRAKGVWDPSAFRAVIAGSQLGTTLPPRRLFPPAASAPGDWKER